MGCLCTLVDFPCVICADRHVPLHNWRHIHTCYLGTNFVWMKATPSIAMRHSINQLSNIYEADTPSSACIAALHQTASVCLSTYQVLCPERRKNQSRGPNVWRIESRLYAIGRENACQFLITPRRPFLQMNLFGDIESMPTVD